MPYEPGERRSRRVVATAVVVVLFLVGSCAVVLTRESGTARDAARDDAAIEARAAAVEVTRAVAVATSSLLAMTVDVPALGPASVVNRRGDALLGTSFVPADRSAAVGTVDGAVFTDPDFAVLASRARDSGAIEVGGVVAGYTPIVRALYDIGGSLSARPPIATTNARRESFAGLLVGIVDFSTVADGNVEISDGDDIVTTAVATDGERAETAVDIGGRRYRIVAFVEVDRSLSAWSWVSFVGIVVLTMLGIWLFGRIETARRHSETVTRRERRRGETISELAATLQNSLELADVLPSLTVQLADRFGLDAVAISIADDSGELQRVFVHGTATDPNVPSLLEIREPLAAGATACLALTRGGRLIAELRFRAGDPIDAADLDTIKAVAELVTSAIVTAQAVARQQRAMDQLTELDGLKTVFLSTAAHELRTPVTAVNGLAELLHAHWEQLPETERKNMAGRIAANGRSLGALVQDLLDFSRLETGDIKHDTQPIDLSQLVANLVDRLRVVWGDNDVDVDVDDGPPVAGDALALERVITNLVSNAAKYAGPDTKIRIGVVHRGGHAELTVDDEGPGVAPAERERIFGRFYRGDGPEVLKTRGVGIGLSVVREFVRQTGGNVEVLDSPLGGARFLCRFPHATITATPLENADV